MTLRESDDCVVPLKREDQSRGSKPGNSGAGKAVRPSRDSDNPATVLSDGLVLARLDRNHPSRGWMTSDGREPDALTAHVRF
jgi:hypothetical protein